jgi:hypothetical protein
LVSIFSIYYGNKWKLIRLVLLFGGIDRYCPYKEEIMAITRIFISYRHDDTAKVTGRLVKRLKRTQDQIFHDTSNIQVADHFPKKIEKALSEADIVLVVIGKKWLDARDSTGDRRIDDPDDFVRREIAYSIRRKETDCFMDIIPVLMPGAKMPRAADLPGELQSLASIDALTIRSKNFDESVDSLSRRIDELRSEHSKRADDSLDDIDDYLSSKDIGLSDVLSMSPTYARNPDLHDLPQAAEWICTQEGVFKFRFETFEDLFFEGQQLYPDNFDVEGSWAYKPGPEQTLVMELSGKMMSGKDFKETFPIQEKVGRHSYGGYDIHGQYYRLQCLQRKDNSRRNF